MSLLQIPSILSWHPDGGIFMIGNERCQFQIMDVALATLKQQLLSEDVTPCNLVDITSYFRYQDRAKFYQSLLLMILVLNKISLVSLQHSTDSSILEVEQEIRQQILWREFCSFRLLTSPFV